MHNRFNAIDHTDRASATRVVSKQTEMRPHRLNLNRVIVQASRALEEVLGPNITLQISCDQDLPPVLAVTHMIKVALMDLCAAARTAMRGEGRATVGAAVKMIDNKHAGRLLEQRKAEFICISIRFNNDHGDEAANKNLANVYAIAQQHCGWLEIARQDEGAASFDLYIPVATNADGTTFVGDRTVEIPGGRETILL